MEAADGDHPTVLFEARDFATHILIELHIALRQELEIQAVHESQGHVLKLQQGSQALLELIDVAGNLAEVPGHHPKLFALQLDEAFLLQQGPDVQEPAHHDPIGLCRALGVEAGDGKGRQRVRGVKPEAGDLTAHRPALVPHSAHLLSLGHTAGAIPFFAVVGGLDPLLEDSTDLRLVLVHAHPPFAAFSAADDGAVGLLVTCGHLQVHTGSYAHQGLAQSAPVDTQRGAAVVGAALRTKVHVDGAIRSDSHCLRKGVISSLIGMGGLQHFALLQPQAGEKLLLRHLHRRSPGTFRGHRGLGQRLPGHLQGLLPVGSEDHLFALRCLSLQLRHQLGDVVLQPQGVQRLLKVRHGQVAQQLRRPLPALPRWRELILLNRRQSQD
mmetsp:Transcript_108386/g.258654  ORF Transcript_108386/g.258654 Transcript_108386/m.258654 type:complete len:383 (-) Transcript_108386:2400-3548(-)